MSHSVMIPDNLWRVIAENDPAHRPTASARAREILWEAVVQGLHVQAPVKSKKERPQKPPPKPLRRVQRGAGEESWTRTVSRESRHRNTFGNWCLRPGNREQFDEWAMKVPLVLVLEEQDGTARFRVRWDELRASGDYLHHTPDRYGDPRGCWLIDTKAIHHSGVSWMEVIKWL